MGMRGIRSPPQEGEGGLEGWNQGKQWSNQRYQLAEFQSDYVCDADSSGRPLFRGLCDPIKLMRGAE